MFPALPVDAALRPRPAEHDHAARPPAKRGDAWGFPDVRYDMQKFHRLIPSHPRAQRTLHNRCISESHFRKVCHTMGHPSLSGRRPEGTSPRGAKGIEFVKPNDQSCLRPLRLPAAQAVEKPDGCPSLSVAVADVVHDESGRPRCIRRWRVQRPFQVLPGLAAYPCHPLRWPNLLRLWPCYQECTRFS